jgi:hypothetical protein
MYTYRIEHAKYKTFQGRPCGSRVEASGWAGGGGNEKMFEGRRSGSLLQVGIESYWKGILDTSLSLETSFDSIFNNKRFVFNNG